MDRPAPRPLTAAAALAELRATGRLAHATLSEPLSLRDLAIDEVITQSIHLVDCRIPRLDGWYTTYEAPVLFERCEVGAVQLTSTFFLAGLAIRGCTFTGLFTVECGGHNKGGAVVELSGCTFHAFANFFDCLYEGPFVARDCAFEAGTNLLGNQGTPYSCAFGTPPEITGCTGAMEINGG